MCGRFTQRLDAEAWSSLLNVTVPNTVGPNFNAAPTQRLLVYATRAEQLPWSFRPAWAERKELKPVINARVETAAEKPFFRSAWKTGRCVVPATGFVEWQKRISGKHPHHITLTDEEPFVFAGLRDNGGFAILTTEPNSLMAEIHNRMPVILRLDEIEAWLDAADWVARGSDEMTATEIGRAINSPANNGPEVLRPA